ncbi:MAG: GNAT family N-acetyltransferase [Gammaproteobacteria bacterium]
MRLVERIHGVYRSRGLTGLLRFLSTRIFRRSEDLLFERDLGASRTGAAPVRLHPVIRIGRENVGSARVAAIERQVLAGENEAYGAGLLRNDLLFAHLDDDGRVLTYAFVLFTTEYKRVLQEPSEVPMIGNCYTVPDARGRGLYARMLVTVSDDLAVDGHRRAIISCQPDNVASMRGIERAGFKRARHITSFIALSKLVLWRVTRPF